MNAQQDNGDWSGLLELMTRRFSQLTDQVLANLEALLDAGRRIMNCAEIGLMVPDAGGSHLKFLVSLNSRADASDIVKTVLVPTDRSIVGCVFNTGQSIAVANPEDFYALVDQKTGLTTNIYLATPVMDHEEILGVATFVNRPSGIPQNPFNEQEMEASARIADLAAVGLRYYLRMCLQQRLLNADLAERARRFAESSPSNSNGIATGSFESLPESPLARAVLTLEHLSVRDQDLAAELLKVISSHASESKTTA